jgi:AhpD family alkylhydroperoxidase
MNMMLDWNEYRRDRPPQPRHCQGLYGLNASGAKKNLLGAEVRELIALAVAVTARCDGCITVHTDAAIKNGATEDEVAEALGVAIAVNAGAALVYSTRVMDAYKSHEATRP